MTLRSLLIGFTAVLAFGLAGCGADESASGTHANASALVQAPAAKAAAAAARPTRNHIELSLAGETYMADSASSFGQRFQGNLADPRYDFEMTSGWVGNNQMSIVRLNLLNLDGRSRTVALDGSRSNDPALMLFEIPGRSGQRWRSTAGTLHLEIEDDGSEPLTVSHLTGTFDATFRQLDRFRDELLEDGEEIKVEGRFDFIFDFSRDRM